MQEWNAAFVGGGVASVEGLGGYAELCTDIEFQGFSGASIGAVIAAYLAAGKNPIEIRDFLMSNVKKFCKPMIGRKRIQKEVDEFLGKVLFKDLPKECSVSITPLRNHFPCIITRDNAENLTVGQVVALSATLPGLFLPAFVRLEGKKAFVLDGGILLNPPLKEGAKNFVFSYENSESWKDTAWNRRRWAQEKKADCLFRPRIECGVFGDEVDIYALFAGGKLYMEEAKSFYLGKFA